MLFMPWLDCDFFVPIFTPGGESGEDTRTAVTRGRGERRHGADMRQNVCIKGRRRDRLEANVFIKGEVGGEDMGPMVSGTRKE